MLNLATFYTHSNNVVDQLNTGNWAQIHDSNVSYSDVTRIGVTRRGNCWCHPILFFQKT